MYTCLLKHYRKKAGISQATLSYAINISQNTISDYEHDKIVPNLKHADLLANFFKVSIYDLFHLISEGYQHG